MNLDEFRRTMDSYRREADREATRQKNSFIVQRRLLQLYDRLDAHERLMANEVFGEWALSDDEATRFDALVLINERKIDSALPSLQQLSERLRGVRLPSALFELEKVERIIAEIRKSKLE